MVGGLQAHYSPDPCSVQNWARRTAAWKQEGKQSLGRVFPLKVALANSLLWSGALAARECVDFAAIPYRKE